jgi:chlorophyllide a reductase subunit X
MKTSAARAANYQIIGKPDGEWGPLFEQLATQVADAPPKHPEPLDQDGLLNLFSSETTGQAYVLEPASMADMCGGEVHEKPSLEVIYDTV